MPIIKATIKYTMRDGERGRKLRVWDTPEINILECYSDCNCSNTTKFTIGLFLDNQIIMSNFTHNEDDQIFTADLHIPNNIVPYHLYITVDCNYPMHGSLYDTSPLPLQLTLIGPNKFNNDLFMRFDHCNVYRLCNDSTYESNNEQIDYY